MKVSELLKTHPEYNREVNGIPQLQLHGDLYEGGERFEKNKSKYLHKRLSEDKGQGAEIRKLRVLAACYVPHMAGIIDNFIATILTAPPVIKAEGPEESVKYYESLNKNADGFGRDLPAITRDRLLQTMLNWRSYFCLHFPEAGEQPSPSLADQIKAGKLDARLRGIDATVADDWEVDADGELVWLRTHTLELVRSGDFGPFENEKHSWTFYTETAQIVWTATKKIGEEFAKDAEATQAETIEKLPAFPVVDVSIPRGLWVANRLAQPALSLFNREASLDHNLNQGAYPAPVLKRVEEGGADVFSNEMMAVVLTNAASDFHYAEPSGASYAALATNCEKKKTDLYSAFGAMYLAAAAEADAGRASGSQLKRKAAPLEVMCRAFAMAIIDALEKALAIIREVRKDTDVNIKIEGLDKFDTFALETEIARVNALVSIPGMPTGAQNHAAVDIFKKQYPDAPDAATETEPALTAAGGKPVTNARTGEPNKMGAQAIAQKYTPATPAGKGAQ